MPPASEPPAIIAAQPVAATPFRPRTDRPYRLRIEQERDDAGAPRRFATERLIRFRRSDTSWEVEVTPVAKSGTAAGGGAAPFVRMQAALGARPMRFRLDRSGGVVSLDDAATHWSAFVAGLSGAASDPAGQAVARKVAEQFAALPADRRLTMLSSTLTPAIAVTLIRTCPHAERPFRRGGAGPVGADATLAGTERCWRDADDMFHLEQRSSGKVRGPGGVVGERTTMTVRRADPTTGLLDRQVETVRTTTGTATGTSTTTTTLTAESWVSRYPSRKPRFP